MRNATSKYFNQSDLDKIAAAVKIAERKTSGEIVPYFAPESDDYEEAVWRSALLFGSIPLATVAGLRLFSDLWLTTSALQISLLFFAASMLGAFLAYFFAPFKRFFAGKDLMHHRCSQRATQAFLSEELFKTHDRTGILIFISFHERIVVVLGDSGIDTKVHQNEWDRVVQTIVDGMKRGNQADGLVQAIGQCGELLRRRGLKRRAKDKDELSDRLRVGKK